MKPQFASRRHPKPLETHHGAAEVEKTRRDAQIFQPALPPRLLPQGLQTHDSLDIVLVPSAPEKMACPAPYPLLEGLLFPARYTESLRLCHPRHCVPNRARRLLSLVKTQNCDAWRVESNPTRSEPLQQDYAHSPRGTLPNGARWLMRLYH